MKLTQVHLRRLAGYATILIPVRLDDARSHSGRLRPVVQALAGNRNGGGRMANEKVRGKVLIVGFEDTPYVIDLAKLILARKGFDVVGSADGREALEIARELEPDLVLLW